MATQTVETNATEVASRGSFLKNNLREYGLLMSLVVIMVFFQIQTNGTLFQPLNLTNLILQNSYIIVMALGLSLIHISEPTRPY